MHQESFTYKQNDYSFVFPIDYTTDELCRDWQVNVRTFKRYLAEHCLIKDTLSQLVTANERMKLNLGKKIPLPVEAEPFLRCFYFLATEPQFKSLLMGSEDYEQLEYFSSQLCEELAKNILLPENDSLPDLNAFCRHILFQNENFDEIIMKRQWEDQINLRIERIRQLAEQVSVSEQARILRQCLQQLDNILFNLNDEIEEPLQCKKFQCKKSPPLPQELLEALLSKRIGGKKESSEEDYEDYASYVIKNLKVELKSEGGNETKNLEEVFLRLSVAFSREKSWLKQARIVYLCDLATEETPSDFESKYLDLIEYLNLSSGKISKDKLDTKIIDAVKRVCIQELLNCCDTVVRRGSSLMPLIKPFEDTYIHDFLKGMSHRKFAAFRLVAGRTRELLNTAKASHQFWKKWLDEKATNPEKELTTKDVLYRVECIRNVVEPFGNLFADIWARLYGPGFVHLMEAIPKYEGDFRQRFRGEGLLAADYFGLRKEFDKRINQLLNDELSCNDIEFVALCDVNIALLEGYFQILYYAIKDVSKSIETGLKFFQQYQTSAQN